MASLSASSASSDHGPVLWEVERSASGLEGGPFRAVLLNLGLLERRQILEGAAEGLRSGLLKARR